MTRPIYKAIQTNGGRKNDTLAQPDQGKPADKEDENEVGEMIPNDKEFLDWMKGTVQVVKIEGII